MEGSRSAHGSEAASVVWNGAGLCPSMTGIERLASAYTHQLHGVEPSIRQTFIAEAEYDWLPLLHPSVVVLLVPHKRGTVLAPRWSGRLGASAWHSWANPLYPRPHMSSRCSVTIHDWTPFTDGEMKLRYRSLWRGAMLANLFEASALHFTTPQVYDSTPRWLRKWVLRKEVLIGGDVVTLPTVRAVETAERYVLAVGTMIPRKRLNELCEVWSGGEMEGAPRLVVVGRGTEALGAGVRHQGLGYVDELMLASLLAGALALVTVSDAEGLNLPAREALRAGVPVIGAASAVGDLQGQAGVHVLSRIEWNAKRKTGAALRGVLDVATRGPRPRPVESHSGDALSGFLVKRARRLAGDWE